MTTKTNMHRMQSYTPKFPLSVMTTHVEVRYDTQNFQHIKSA